VKKLDREAIRKDLDPRFYYWEIEIMKPCPVLLAIKNNRIVAIPDCQEACIIKIKRKCLLSLVTEFLRKLVDALTEK
jgi:hypothetical protein